MKAPKEEQKIQPYDFFNGFTKIEEELPEEEAGEQEEDGEEEEEEIAEGPSPEEILEQAKARAHQILADAKEQADALREQAYEEGMEAGRKQGFDEAHAEQRSLLDGEVRELQRAVAEVVESVTIEKDKLIENSVDSLKDISISVAEKIIRTSLQSSGDIVKRMILAATEKMKKRQWAKIYVTKCKTGFSLEVDTEFLERLSHLSDNVKIVTIDSGEEGTCIIELPDEIVDASVGTQLENIKDVINNARM